MPNVGFDSTAKPASTTRANALGKKFPLGKQRKFLAKSKGSALGAFFANSAKKAWLAMRAKVKGNFKINFKVKVKVKVNFKINFKVNFKGNVKVNINFNTLGR